MPRPHHARRRLVTLAIAVAAGLGLALAIDVARTGSMELWLTRRGLAPPYVGEGRRIDIGGRALYLDCRGTGSPTVILENGLGAGAGHWGYVLPKAAERTRVCAYDRAGLGRSDAHPQPNTVGEAMADLRRALEGAGEHGPFIVVGHSLGGVHARVFAAQYPTETRGVVLVDAYFPDGIWYEEVDVDPGWIADHEASLASTEALIAEVERLRWPESEGELARSELAGIPLEVLAVDQHLRYQDARVPADVEEALIAAWERWCLALSPGATRVTIAEGSGHVIQLDRPDVVLAAIDRLVDAARQTD